MKKIILSLFVFIITSVTNAQIETPAPSPFQKIEQKVGLTDVTIVYSRPSIKGRKIFGGLVSFEEIWRTGANSNTKLSFSTDFMIDGQQLKKGTYALYTIPGEKLGISSYIQMQQTGELQVNGMEQKLPSK